MQAIKKLKEHKIFAKDSIVESIVKVIMGIPFLKTFKSKTYKKITVFVKRLVKQTV